MGDISFRRIHGHIVPIKINPQQRQHQAVVGAAETVAGTSAIAGAGILGAKVVQASAHHVAESRMKFKAGKAILGSFKAGQMSFNDVSNINRAQGLLRTAVKQRRFAMKAFKLRNNILRGGAVLGAGLLASGFSKLREAATGKKTNHEVASKVAAIGASASVYGIYYNRLPVGGLGKVVANTIARMANKQRPFKASWYRG